MKSKIKVFFSLGLVGLSTMAITPTINVDADSTVDAINTIFAKDTYAVCDLNPILYSDGISYTKENGLVNFKSKTRYKLGNSLRTFSMLDTKNYDYEYKNYIGTHSAYVVVYLNESPFDGEVVNLGVSKGLHNTEFSKTYSVDNSYELSHCVTITESAEAEVWGNKIEGGIKQSIAASSTTGSVHEVSFTFSYDPIEDFNTIYSATLTPKKYYFIVRIFTPEISYSSLINRILGKYTIKYVENDMVLAYSEVIKQIDIQ